MGDEVASVVQNGSADDAGRTSRGVVERPSFLGCALACMCLAGCRTRDDVIRHAERAEAPASQVVFVVGREWDPRFVSILRRGVQPGAPATLSVFQVAADGRELRLDSHTVLHNQRGPRHWSVVGAGRYVVTVDDVDSVGVGPCCLVIYDTESSVSRARGIEEFLAADIIRGLPADDLLPGRKWCVPTPRFSASRLEFYPTAPTTARQERLPFVVVDLQSLGVRHAPVPLDTSDGAWIRGDDACYSMAWTCDPDSGARWVDGIGGVLPGALIMTPIGDIGSGVETKQSAPTVTRYDLDAGECKFHARK